MQTLSKSLFNRSDTLFGVCQGLGEDLGFDPLWARLAFGVAFLFNPPAVAGGYALIGAAVMLARWAFPVAGRRAAGPVVAIDAPAPTRDEAEMEPLKLAA